MRIAHCSCSYLLPTGRSVGKAIAAARLLLEREYPECDLRQASQTSGYPGAQDAPDLDAYFPPRESCLYRRWVGGFFAIVKCFFVSIFMTYLSMSALSMSALARCLSIAYFRGLGISLLNCPCSNKNINIGLHNHRIVPLSCLDNCNVPHKDYIDACVPTRATRAD